MSYPRRAGSMSTLVSVFDGLSFAPAAVGTLVRLTLDVSGNGQVVWYEKQRRTPGENYVVWRRVPEPANIYLDEEDSIPDEEMVFYEEPEESEGRSRGLRVSNIIESEFLAGHMLAEADRRWGRVERVWVNEEQ